MPWAQPDSKIDGRGVYGFNWWRNGLKPDGTRKLPAAPQGMFWASGHNNNKCFVIPEWDMVIVRIGLDGKAKDDVWNEFLAEVRIATHQPLPKFTIREFSQQSNYTDLTPKIRGLTSPARRSKCNHGVQFAGQWNFDHSASQAVSVYWGLPRELSRTSRSIVLFS